MHRRIAPVVFALAFLGHAWAAEFRDEGALRGVTAVGAVFDITTGDPDKLLLRLELLERTWRQLRDSGVEPRIVAAFRGPASRWLTTGGASLATEPPGARLKIREVLARFRAQGFALEQCAIAAKMLHIDPGDFLPEIQVVRNGYISLIGYQRQGYSYVPMD